MLFVNNMVNNKIRIKIKHKTETSINDTSEEYKSEMCEVLNMDGLSYLNTVNNNTVDLVLTDPPYITSKKSGMDEQAKIVKNYNENRKKRDVYFDDQKKENIEKINKDNTLKKKEIENSEDDNLFKNEDDPWMKKNDINKEKEISQLLVSLLDNNMIPHNGPYDEYKEKIKELL